MKKTPYESPRSKGTEFMTGIMAQTATATSSVEKPSLKDSAFSKSPVQARRPDPHPEGGDSPRRNLWVCVDNQRSPEDKDHPVVRQQQCVVVGTAFAFDVLLFL